MKQLFMSLIFSLSLFGESQYENGKLLYNAKGCSNCHGTNAEGSNEAPRLANKSKTSLASKLQRFQAGVATNQNQQIMIGFAQGLSDKELDAITTYLSHFKKEQKNKYQIDYDLLGSDD